jgi:hypothetical protein
MEAALKDANTEKDELAKALAATKKELADEQTKKSTQYLALAKQVDDMQGEIDEMKKKDEFVKDDYKRNTEKREKKLRELKNQVDRLKGELNPSSAIDLDQPKGKIVQLDRRGETAYVNLGSADGVRQGLTFSVFGASGAGKAQGERKGALEIVQAIAPHMAVAHVIDVTDPGRNPVIVNDLIFNPAWSPGLKQHIAIAGFIDLTGEGHDNLVEFMRNLEKMGITVDAYLDLKDLQVKGPGMDLHTSFFVLGDQPVPSEQQISREQSARQRDIITKITQMQTEATSNGIPIVPLRRFLGIVGYPLPKNINRPGAVFEGMPPSKSIEKKGTDSDDKDKPDQAPDKDK